MKNKEQGAVYVPLKEEEEEEKMSKSHTDIDTALIEGNKLCKQLDALKTVREQNYVDMPATLLLTQKNIPRKWARNATVVGALLCMSGIIFVLLWLSTLLAVVKVNGLHHEQFKKIHSRDKQLRKVIDKQTKTIQDYKVVLNRTQFAMGQTLKSVEHTQNCIKNFNLKPDDSPINLVKLRKCLGFGGSPINI